MAITIQGGSDDLLNITGDIQEEFNVDSDEPFYMGVSDGSLWMIEYDENAIWRILSLVKGENHYEKVEGDVSKDTNDILTIYGANKIAWILVGNHRVIAKQPDDG